MRFISPDSILVSTLRSRARCEEIHIWPFLLDGSEAAKARCEALLSSTEKDRARRFYREEHRRAYIFAHGVMRFVLGAYCEREPAGLSFAAGQYGKPRLDEITPVSFNLSHSHGRALLAVSRDREVGVDIEREDARTNALGIASSYFFSHELDAIRAAGPDKVSATFFRFWAAKEAVLKAQGVGLHASLNSFHVCFEPDLETASVETLDESRIASGWRVRRLACDAGWHAAVAAQATDWQEKVIEEATVNEA